MIVKYELYEQPTVKLLQHGQCWHLFIYSQSALKAALTWKPWGFCIGASPCKSKRTGNLWTLLLMTVVIIKLIRRPDLSQNGPWSLMVNAPYECQNSCVCWGGCLPPLVPKKCSSAPGLACTRILHGWCREGMSEGRKRFSLFWNQPTGRKSAWAPKMDPEFAPASIVQVFI